MRLAACQMIPLLIMPAMKWIYKAISADNILMLCHEISGNQTQSLASKNSSHCQSSLLKGQQAYCLCVCLCRAYQPLEQDL